MENKLKLSEALRKSTRTQAFGVYYCIKLENGDNIFLPDGYQPDSICACALGACFEELHGLPQSNIFSFSSVLQEMKDKIPELSIYINRDDFFRNIKGVMNSKIFDDLYAFFKSYPYDFSLITLITKMNDVLLFDFVTIADVLEANGY